MEPGDELWSMGSHRGEFDLATKQQHILFYLWNKFLKLELTG